MSHPLIDVETLDGPAIGAGGVVKREIVLTVLAHPSAARVGARALLRLAAPGDRVALSRSEPHFTFAGATSAPLLSPFVSRKPVVLAAHPDGGLTLDARASGSRVEIDGLAMESALLGPTRLDAGVVVQLGTHVVLHLQREYLPIVSDDDDVWTVRDGLVGVSAGIVSVRRAIREVADKPGAVLVRGETGTGKELVARALHLGSRRRDRPFVAINVAAIPGTLVASQLFGHVRGAFSGAERAHDGFFMQADGGTLFLDEIADAAPEVQAALLRVLESGEVQAVGARTVQHVDVRVVAATDGDLEAAVAAGRFRAPLFYRLAAHELTVPPLRARRADIGLLLVTCLGETLDLEHKRGLLEPSPTEASPWLPAGLVASLARHPWPGNVRQLKSLAALMASGPHRTPHAPLALDDPRWRMLVKAGSPAPPAVPAVPEKFGPARESGGAKAREPRHIDPDELEAVMAANDYRLAAAAAHFGISRPTLNQLIDRHPRLRRAQRIDAAEIAAALASEAAGHEPAWRTLRVSETGLRRRIEELGLPPLEGPAEPGCPPPEGPAEPGRTPPPVESPRRPK